MVEKGFKNTEIGFYPNDWIIEDLGEIISNVQLGGNYPNNDVDGEYILIKMGNIARGHIDLKKKYFIKKGITPNEIDRLHSGDVIFNTRNTLELVGKVAIWKNEENPAYFNSNIMRIKFKEDKISSDDFMNLILNTPTSLYQLRGIATGTTSVAAIYPRDLYKIKIPLPPKAEQTAIATALNDTDTLIEKLEQLIAKKRNVKTATMQQLLKPKEGWEVKKLGEVAKINTGSKNNEDKVDGGEYPFFVRSATVERINSYSYDCEAILIPGDGNIGEIFHYINGKFEVHQRVYIISNFTKEVLGKYVYLWFMNYFKEHALKYTSKNTVDSLRLPTFKEFEICCPPTDEQTRIAQILSDMDSEIEALERQLAKYKLLKQGLMQVLLTGKIRLV